MKNLLSAIISLLIYCSTVPTLSAQDGWVTAIIPDKVNVPIGPNNRASFKELLYKRSLREYADKNVTAYKLIDPTDNTPFGEILVYKEKEYVYINVKLRWYDDYLSYGLHQDTFKYLGKSPEDGKRTYVSASDKAPYIQSFFVPEYKMYDVIKAPIKTGTNRDGFLYFDTAHEHIETAIEGYEPTINLK